MVEQLLAPNFLRDSHRCRAFVIVFVKTGAVGIAHIHVRIGIVCTILVVFVGAAATNIVWCLSARTAKTSVECITPLNPPLLSQAEKAIFLTSVAAHRDLTVVVSNRHY